MRWIGKVTCAAVLAAANVVPASGAGCPGRTAEPVGPSCDAVVSHALAILSGECIYLPARTPIAPARLPVEISHVVVRVDAWTDGRTIWVNLLSPEYRRAAHGDRRALAAILAHEGYHVAHGAAEAPAYAEQLRVLKLLGAPGRQTAAVERALRYATLGDR